MALEGATDLYASLTQAGRPSWLKSDLCWDVFLLSDGAATWGASDLYGLSKTLQTKCVNALFAYTTGFSDTDTHVLRHLARESGGAVFSMVGETEVAQASRAHRCVPWQLESITLAGTHDVLLAGRPHTIFPGQQLLLVGRGTPTSGADIVMHLKRGKQAHVVNIPIQHVIASELAPRVYGQVAVAQLEDFKEATEGVAKAYATHFRVTGRTCSLLMLESEADYKRYNIKPRADAFVVKSKPVAKMIRKVLQDIGNALGDARVAFLNWLKKLERTPGVTFKVSTALQTLLEALPAATFVVETSALQCKAHTRHGIPEALQKQLRSRPIDYNVVNAEARRRHRQLGAADALKALSCLIEKNPTDTVLARDVAFSAMQWQLGAHAYHLLHRVAQARPYEPQTYPAMARSLSQCGNVELALAYYEVALAGKWDWQFGEFHRILGIAYLRLLRRIVARHPTSVISDYAASRIPFVVKKIGMKQADLLILISWNTDDSDVDLHVMEPSGETCYYSHRNTKIGGHITIDVTQGYGPEMYILPKAIPGKYRARVRYYAVNRNRVSARTKVYATVIRNWGTTNETIQNRIVTLTEQQEMHDIATVSIEK